MYAKQPMEKDRGPIPDEKFNEFEEDNSTVTSCFWPMMTTLLLQ